MRSRDFVWSQRRTILYSLRGEFDRQRISPISDMPIGDFESLAKIVVAVAGTPGDFRQSPRWAYTNYLVCRWHERRCSGSSHCPSNVRLGSYLESKFWVFELLVPWVKSVEFRAIICQIFDVIFSFRLTDHQPKGRKQRKVDQKQIYYSWALANDEKLLRGAKS